MGVVTNCEAKQSRQRGNQMEVILKTSTEITASPRALEASVFSSFEPVAKKITLGEMGTLDNLQKMIADMKILTKMEAINVSGGKRNKMWWSVTRLVQSRWPLWEEYVESLQMECSYQLKNFVIQEYASQKYLSMPRAGEVISPIDDIGDVVEPVSKVVTLTEICNVEIIGVPQLDCYKACLKCKARVEPVTSHLGKCSNLGCAMMQRYDRCPNQLSAKLIVMWVDRKLGACTQSLFAYVRIVGAI